MRKNVFAALRNFQPVEEITVVDAFPTARSLLLEEAANHKLVERLAETPRTSK